MFTNPDTKVKVTEQRRKSQFTSQMHVSGAETWDQKGFKGAFTTMTHFTKPSKTRVHLFYKKERNTGGQHTVLRFDEKFMDTFLEKTSGKIRQTTILCVKWFIPMKATSAVETYFPLTGKTKNIQGTSFLWIVWPARHCWQHQWWVHCDWIIHLKLRPG